MLLTSPQNSKVAKARKLLDKKYRKSSGLYLIEGERLISDAQKHGAHIEEIFVKQSVADKLAFDEAVVLVDNVFAKLQDTVNSQGVIAVVRQPEQRFDAPNGNCIVLDGLQDPGNVGTLIRTAAACGFSDVFAVNSVDLFSPKVLRSAMSAHFCVGLHQTDDIADVFRLLNSADCQIVAADMEGENVFTARLSPKVALVLGNEGNGLSEYSRRNAHITVSLPMQNDFESLNVAVAGSVIMYLIGFAG